jgi:tRNA (adenine57-N1/adenine58-N1)-methyltransferase
LRHTQAGDLVLLVNEKDRQLFIRMLKPGDQLQTHRGMVLHDDLIGLPYGTQVRSHLGFPFYLLPPTTDELIRNIRRESQIVFPKDSGYIMMKLGIRPGAVVIEAGTGSGGLCVALASMVGDDGHVYSYDNRPKMLRLAGLNLERVGMAHRVTLKSRDILDGFEETAVDAVFLDVRAPWEALDQAHAALTGGGVLGCIVPTNNQLVELIGRLDAHPGFGFVEAEELLLRPYKTVPARIRPADQVVGHTGFLVFCRAIVREAHRVEPATREPGESDSEGG